MGLYAKLKETVSEAAIFGSAPIFTSLLSFLLTFVYTRYFDREQYGQLFLLVAADQFTSQLLQFGLGTAFFRSYFDEEKRDKRGVIMNTTVWFLVSVNIGFALIAAPFAGWFARVNKLPDPTLVLLLILFTVLNAINTVPFLIFKARKESRKYVAVQWIAAIGQFLAIVAFVIPLHLNVRGAMLGLIVGALIQALAYFWMLRSQIRFEFSFEELKPLLALGFPMIFNALATKILIVSDRFFINHYLSASDVALYGLGNTLCSVLPMLVSNPFNLVWPAMRFEVKNDDDAGEYYSLILTYLTFLSLYFGLGISVLAPDVLRVAFPPTYAATATVVPLFALYYLLASTAKGINVGLMVEKKVYWNPIIVLTTAGVNIVLNYLFIPKYGMIGAGWATVISYAFLNWFRYVISNRYYPVRYEWSRIVRMCVAALFLYVVANAITLDSPAASFLIKFLIAASFPFVLILFRFYEPRESARIGAAWAAIRTRIRKALGRKNGESTP